MEEIKFTGKVVKDLDGTYTFETGEGKKVELRLGDRPAKYFSKLEIDSFYYVIYDIETNLISFVKKTDEPKELDSITINPIINKRNNISVFEKLNSVKCKVDKKGKFNYVSWAEAWKEVKRLFPTANYRVIPYISKTVRDSVLMEIEKLVHPISKDGGGFVKIGVMINDLEHIEYYPILNNFNKPILYDLINANDVNNSIKRGLAKCLALHGLGLYIYQGEDLPEGDEQ